MLRYQTYNVHIRSAIGVQLLYAYNLAGIACSKYSMCIVQDQIILGNLDV